MRFKFVGVDPLSTGCALTEEKREGVIEQIISGLSGATMDSVGKNKKLVIMRGPPRETTPPASSWKNAIEWFKLFLEERQLVVVRRRLVGYEWRIYVVNDQDVLLYAPTTEEYKEAVKNGYEVSVISTGTRLTGGHAISYPIQWPFLEYVKIATTAKSDWNAYMEKQSVRVQAR
jgi:hypothetical protein